jgi:hypothetical protein
MLNVQIFKFSIVFLLIFKCCTAIEAQKTTLNFPQRPFKTLSIESYLSIIPDSFNNDAGVLKQHLEYMYNITLFTNLSARWQIGLQYNHIWTKIEGNSTDKFYILGLVSRFNMDISHWLKLYGEPGIGLGNYCFCLNNVRQPDERPFKKENMFYGSLGIGFMVKIYHPLWLRVGASGYKWLNPSKDIYFGGINVPTVGLSLNFGY